MSGWTEEIRMDQIVSRWTEEDPDGSSMSVVEGDRMGMTAMHTAGGLVPCMHRTQQARRAKILDTVAGCCALS
jgi:hypothetical protein